MYGHLIMLAQLWNAVSYSSRFWTEREGKGEFSFTGASVFAFSLGKESSVRAPHFPTSGILSMKANSNLSKTVNGKLHCPKWEILRFICHEQNTTCLPNPLSVMHLEAAAEYLSRWMYCREEMATLEKPHKDRFNRGYQLSLIKTCCIFIFLPT